MKILSTVAAQGHLTQAMPTPQGTQAAVCTRVFPVAPNPVVLHYQLGDLSNLRKAISHLIQAMVVGSSAFCLSLFERKTNAYSGGCATVP